MENNYSASKRLVSCAPSAHKCYQIVICVVKKKGITKCHSPENLPSNHADFGPSDVLCDSCSCPSSAPATSSSSPVPAAPPNFSGDLWIRVPGLGLGWERGGGSSSALER